MKKLWLWLLPLLLLGACMPNNDDEVLIPVYRNGLVHVDSLGQVEFLPDPEISRTALSVERLPDGRVLLIHDSLHIYNPETQELSHITPTGHYSYYSPPGHDLSPDGNKLYHNSLGSIRSLDLTTNHSELHAVADWDCYVRPVISKDGRYLTYLQSSNGIYSTSHDGGYPIIKDLLSGTYTDLSSGNAATDHDITYAMKSKNSELIYYISDHTLMVMDMQGNNRTAVRDNVSYVVESSDGRFMLCFDSYFYSSGYLSYRDNQSMTWYQLPLMHESQLCRSANILYYVYNKSLIKVDLTSGVQTTIFSNTLEGRKIDIIDCIAPSWDGKDVVAFVRFLTWENSKYPL